MKILIAEDEAVTALMLEAALQKWGHEPMTVHDGDAALAVLSGPEPPPLAILDWMMPGLSGPEIVQRVRQMAPPLPPYLILCTSLSGKAQVVAGLDAGANDYITKPFDIAEVRSRVAVGARMVELQQALANRVQELETALAEVRTLSGLLPICAGCKRIRDDRGYWQQVDAYLHAHTNVKITHGICPKCARELYPDLFNAEGK